MYQINSFANIDVERQANSYGSMFPANMKITNMTFMMEYTPHGMFRDCPHYSPLTSHLQAGEHQLIPL